jgi:Xaa-Pro aminopeptidase
MVRPGGSVRPVQPSFAILPREGRPSLVASAGFAADALAGWVDEIHVWGPLAYDESLPGLPLEPRLQHVHDAQRSASPDAVSALAAALDGHGLSDGSIGVDVEGLGAAGLEELRAALPRARFRDCTALLRLVRAVKSEAEIAWLARTAEINERCGISAAAAARSGDPVADLVQRFRESAASEGTDVDHCSPSTGGVSISSHTDYRFADGEVFCFDFGCCLDGYFSDTGITVALGDVLPELETRHSYLRDAILDVGLSAMRPGSVASSVHHAMTAFLAERGITACFPHGHGIGLELRDYPILVSDTGLRLRDDCIDLPSDLPFEPGMVVNLEVSLFLPGVAGLEVESTMLVTDHGARQLVEQDRARPLLAACAPAS